jgi:two-component system OmpR family sensor kinase
MTRHFVGLYVLIVLTLAAVSWGQDKLLQAYGNPGSMDDKPLALAMSGMESRMRELPADQRRRFVAATAARSGVDLDLFAASEIAGRDTLAKLEHGDIVHMRESDGKVWSLKQIDGQVLALKSVEPDTQRGPLEWALTLVFYAAIALVIMIWIWPLTRDLRTLERAAAQFGNRNWRFDAAIKPHSQIYPLARTFRKMAERIDGLIASHKDMSNAVSHEIKTPLARMQFEIEFAQQSRDIAEVKKALTHIKGDVGAINDLVTAMLDYAILERADMSLNIGTHDFTTLIPAIVDAVQRDTPDIRIAAEVQSDAVHVSCDLHLFEAVLRNLLYNAGRYAKSEVRVAFGLQGGVHELTVDDDGPGIPAPDRQRAFDPFVQLEQSRHHKTGFGLGLAIVKRAMEWHGGGVVLTESRLGGARFCATWPARNATAVGA